MADNWYKKYPKRPNARDIIELITDLIIIIGFLLLLFVAMSCSSKTDNSNALQNIKKYYYSDGNYILETQVRENPNTIINIAIEALNGK